MSYGLMKFSVSELYSVYNSESKKNELTVRLI